MRYHFTPTRWLQTNRWIIRGVGEDMERLERSFIARENVKQGSHFGKHVRVLQILINLRSNFYYFLSLNQILLVYSCFTMLCQLLLYKEMNQLYAFLQPIPLGLNSQPPIPTLYVITQPGAELPVLYSRFNRDRSQDESPPASPS